MFSYMTIRKKILIQHIYHWWWFSRQVISNSWDPMDCRPPSSSVHAIFQERILEWVAISFSRGSFWLKDQTPVSCTVGGFSTEGLPGKPSIVRLLSNTKYIFKFHQLSRLCLLQNFFPFGFRIQFNITHWILSCDYLVSFKLKQCLSPPFLSWHGFLRIGELNSGLSNCLLMDSDYALLAESLHK